MHDRLLRQIAHKTPLAKGSGPFACAERAWTVEQNLDEAERLYRSAIDSNDRLEAAVKRLASLLEQRDRRDDAIALLERYQRSGTTRGAFDQVLATSYEHAGQFDKALELLTRMEQKAEPSKRVVLLRRIARAYFKLQRYQEAERKLQEALRLRPDDHIATKWLASLEEAREAGSYEEAGELLAGLGDVVDLATGLSPLADAMLDQCQFDGVEPSRLSSGQFTLDDVSRLEKLADQLGTQRPRDRAAYYLSAAAILRKVQPEEESQQFADFLQRYFISMGDAVTAQV
jgi:tetratricopeptide (TPR) repeat protein